MRNKDKNWNKFPASPIKLALCCCLAPQTFPLLQHGYLLQAVAIRKLCGSPRINLLQCNLFRRRCAAFYLFLNMVSQWHHQCCWWAQVGPQGHCCRALWNQLELASVPNTAAFHLLTQRTPCSPSAAKTWIHQPKTGSEISFLCFEVHDE